MRAQVHIFADDPCWQTAVERYLMHCLDESLRIKSYLFTDLEVCDRETFAFDAAVVSAFASSGAQYGLAPWGIDLFLRFPGRVVLLSPLWLKPPPVSWSLCVCQPLSHPENLAQAVRAALSSPSPTGPSLEDLRGYLPINPSRTISHHTRRRPNNA
jgi:hypothetical protein